MDAPLGKAPKWLLSLSLHYSSPRRHHPRRLQLLRRRGQIHETRRLQRSLGPSRIELIDKYIAIESSHPSLLAATRRSVAAAQTDRRGARAAQAILNTT